MKKILFSDIDGTIVDKDQPLCSKDQQAIRQLRQQGGLFAYCTGRNYQETKVIADLFEYDYMVLNNGAMIVDRYDKVIFRKQIAHDTAKEILHYCFTHYPYMHYSFYDGKKIKFWKVDLAKEDEIIAENLGFLGNGAVLLADRHAPPRMPAGAHRGFRCGSGNPSPYGSRFWRQARPLF